MIEHFAAQLPFVDGNDLMKLYERAARIPNTVTRANVKSIYEGLVLDGIFKAPAGRAELFQAFRDGRPLLVKIPFDAFEAEVELTAFSDLGRYDPSETCILGPVTRLELQRVGRDLEVALLMPICTCSVASIPRPVENQVVDATAKTLVTSLRFLHSKGRVHGDVKLSNILIRQGGDQLLADLGSSVKFEAKLTTTLNSVPRSTNVEGLLASEALDWFQAGLCLLHLMGVVNIEDRMEVEEVKTRLQTLPHPYDQSSKIILDHLH
jgi:hypothetical protein